MTLLFDCRVLTHKIYTGVENYAQQILDHMQGSCSINRAKPRTSNKYIAHLWAHFVLPFLEGDVIFCPANIAPIMIPKSKRLVVTIHDVAFLTYPQSFSKFFRLYYQLLVPFIIRRADKIITVSQYSKQKIEKFYPSAKGKIEVIYLGNNQKFHKLDNCPKKNQILYVGSINERKNFKNVLKAFECISNPQYRLLIVGNFSDNFLIDEENKVLLAFAKTQANIEFKCDVSNDELVKLYNESKVFIFPSFYEGFGLPVLEAMACGTPVVCSNKSSLPEVGGDAVIYCDPYNIDDIKIKIELVLYNEVLQQKLISNGLERSQMFSWEQSAKQHIKVFEKVFNS